MYFELPLPLIPRNLYRIITLQFHVNLTNLPEYCYKLLKLFNLTQIKLPISLCTLTKILKMISLSLSKIIKIQAKSMENQKLHVKQIGALEQGNCGMPWV